MQQLVRASLLFFLVSLNVPATHGFGKGVMKDMSMGLQLFPKLSAKNFQGALLAKLNSVLTAAIPQFFRSLQGRKALQIIQSLKNMSSGCINESLALVTGLMNGMNSWQVRVIDASGKPLPGLLKGGLHWVGEYEECLSIDDPLRPGNSSKSGPRVQGKYCTLAFDLPKSLTSDYDEKKEALAKEFAVMIDLKLRWDICATKGCSTEDLTTLFTPFIGMLNGTLDLTLADITCKHKRNMLDDKAAVGGLGFLGAIFLIILCGTFYDICVLSGDLKAKLHLRRRKLVSDPYNCRFDLESMSNASFEKENPKAAENIYSVPVSDGQGEGTKTDDVGHVAAAAEENGNMSKKLQRPDTVKETEPVALALNNSPDPLEQTTDDPGFSQPSNKLSKILLAFSIRCSIRNLLDTRQRLGTLGCLNGVRVLSMAWIILGHMHLLSIGDVIKNLTDGLKLPTTFTFQAVLNATLSVDTFFLLSGTLVAHMFFLDYDQSRRITVRKILRLYCHRFWRLTPYYMIIIVIYVCFTNYVGEGPYWPEKNKLTDMCVSNWWTNLLYINNLYRPDQMCMGWTWYLACDMQFYILAPIILSVLVMLPTIGFFTIAILMGIYITATSVLMQRAQSGESVNYYTDVYIKPYSRVSPYLIGFLLSYHLRKGKRKTELPKLVLLVGWILAAQTAIFFTYITYVENKDDEIPWSHGVKTAFEVSSRPLWALAVSWVIFVCTTGNGGIVNDILSWKLWVPLSRVTYGVYLLHPIVIMIALAINQAPLYQSVPTTIYAFIGHTTLSFAAAFVFSVLFERPILGLEKAVFGQ